MPANEIVAAVRRRPFLPFKLLVSDGTSYEIRHPELLHVGLAHVLVVIPHPENPEYMSRSEYIDLRHIVKLVVDEPAASQN